MKLLERSLFFFLGAVAAGAVIALLAGRPVAFGASAAPTAISQEIAQRLEQIDRRLAAMEVQRAQPGAGEESGAKVAAATPVAPPTPAQVRAVEASGAVINRAVGTGTWSRHDTDEFMVASADMRGEDRLELLRQITVAINEDRLKVEAGVTLP